MQGLASHVAHFSWSECFVFLSLPNPLRIYFALNKVEVKEVRNATLPR